MLIKTAIIIVIQIILLTFAKKLKNYYQIIQKYNYKFN